jgi:hypothetical protein
MAQILARVAASVFLLLVAAFVAGLVSWARGARLNADDASFMVHIYLGLVAVLGVLAVHCLVIVYLLGTGRWVKEVASAYALPDDPLPRRTRDIKRAAFPPGLIATLLAIAAAGAGAGVWWQGWHWSAHFTLAVLTVVANLWAFAVAYREVARNGTVIDEVMREVDRVRAERGLPSNAEALRQENGP